MKIEFNDKSYIEVLKEAEKVIIIIQARDYNDSSKKITNSVELTLEQFKQLIR